MHKFFLFFLLFISSILSAQDWKPQNGAFQTDDNYTAFTNANIYKEGSFFKGTLLIKQDKIVDLGSDVTIPDNTIILDLNGKFIYPSFIELYSSYGINELSKKKSSNLPQLESEKKGPYYWNESIKPEVEALPLFNFDKKEAEKMRSMGFGVVSTHHKDGIVRGTSMLINLSDEEKMEVIEENAASYYSFDKGSSKQTYPSSLMGSIALLRQFNYDLEWYQNNRDNTKYNSSLESALKNQDLPKIFDASTVSSQLRADKIAKEFNKQFILYGNGEEYKHLKELQSTESSVMVPINFPLVYDVSDAFEAIQLPLSKMKEWELAPYNLSFLYQNNIPVYITSDGIKNKDDFYKNLSLASQKGATHNDIINSLTIAAAKLLGVDDILGSLAKGKKANFLITSDSLFKKNTKIYSNWISANEYKISEEIKKALVGLYHLKIEKEKEYRLVVENKVDKYAAKISVKGEKNSIPVSIEKEFQRVKLSFVLEEKHYNLTGSISDSSSRIWSGKTLVDSVWLDWAAIKQVVRNKQIEKEEADSSIASDEEVPNIWHPNMAYGWDSVPREAEAIVFRNATVWTNEEEGILENHDVFIEGGIIRMVDYKINMEVMFPKFAKSAMEIDLKGKHLTSGIIDEHSHIAIDRGVNESGQSITSEVRIGDVIKSNDINIYRQLSGGVTAAQLLHGSANPVGGQSALIKLRWGKNGEEMKIEGADGFIKFALGENVKQSNWGDRNRIRFPQTRMGVEQVFYDGFTRAKEYSDAQKIYESNKKKKENSGPRVDLELEALAEILDSQRFITCHSYIQSEINMLMHVADSMDFTINTFTHILEGYKVADKLKKHGASASTFSDWWAYKFEVNDAIPYNGAILHNQGVNTGFNSDDAEMGRRLNQEAAKAVKYGGLSEEDAWKFVTLNPAKMLHLDDRMGSIKVGKDADIVIWSDNPLSVYAKAEQTYIDGIKYFDIKRNEELQKRNSKERNRLVSKMMKSKNNSKSQKIVPKENKLYECDSLEP